MATLAPESAMNGLDPMFNPEWYLTDEQLGLLEQLRKVCEEKIRPLAASNDKTLTCVDCSQEFAFTASEQQFYADRQFSEPRRCPSCRAIRKASRGDSGGYSSGGSGGGSGRKTMMLRGGSTNSAE